MTQPAGERLARGQRLLTEQTLFATANGAMNGFLLDGMDDIGSTGLMTLLLAPPSVYGVLLVSSEIYGCRTGVRPLPDQRGPG